MGLPFRATYGMVVPGSITTEMSVCTNVSIYLCAHVQEWVFEALTTRHWIKNPSPVRYLAHTVYRVTAG